jgi:hypothetical protein
MYFKHLRQLPNRHVFRSRPCLELLECRCLPSTVTNLSDHNPGSLRDAIATTPDGGTVDFQSGLTGSITLTTGELAINKDLTIEGPGADVITVSGNHASRVFNIANFTVAISGLTIADGKVTGQDGGGIYNAGALSIIDSDLSGNSAYLPDNGPAAISGGGVFSSGTLTIIGSTFTDNSVMVIGRIVQDGDGVDGGGISNVGNATISDSKFTGNVAEGTVFTNDTRAGTYFYVVRGDGGGILNTGTLTITDCTFAGNSADLGGGGGISNAGTLKITYCAFSDNTSKAAARFYSSGGVIDNVGMLTATDCTFAGNSADVGGGISNAGTLNITYCAFSNNTSNVAPPLYGGSGGGIYNGNGTLTITASTFSGNSSSGVGGGIENQGTLTITVSTFNGNSAQGNGGGIESFGPSTVTTVTECTFSGNSANGGWGGGIFSGRTLTVTDSTFSGNSASEGGGIWNFPGSPYLAPGIVRIRNTLLAGNSAPSGGPDISGPITSLGHNLIGNGSRGSGYAASDLVGTAANPIDPKLGPLQDNGGPTWTLALLPGSPAIGAGGPTDNEWDQRGPGYARTVNGMTDIGAYEEQPSGAGAAALILHSAQPIHFVPVVALSVPSMASIPLRPVAATVDRIFSSWSNDAVGWVTGRPRHAAGTEALLWTFDPLPV